TRVREVMQTFKATGDYRFENFDRGTFSASRSTDAEIPGIIQRVYREFGYVVDPHTACAFQEHNPERVNVVLSTASPAKFPETIRGAIGLEPTHPSLEVLKSREIVKHRLPATAEAIRAFVDRHAV
ncbi:MAG TPA: threonine synthase, partial [Opitutus sp.]|nr:threonine synthase [Opitutus sp.]